METVLTIAMEVMAVAGVVVSRQLFQRRPYFKVCVLKIIML